MRPTGAVERQDYTLDERGARTALEQIGLDPALLPLSKKQHTAASFDIKARQSTLDVPGGQSPLEGVWRDLRHPIVPGDIGFIDDLERGPGSLTITLRPTPARRR